MHRLRMEFAGDAPARRSHCLSHSPDLGMRRLRDGAEFGAGAVRSAIARATARMTARFDASDRRSHGPQAGGSHVRRLAARCGCSHAPDGGLGNHARRHMAAALVAACGWLAGTPTACAQDVAAQPQGSNTMRWEWMFSPYAHHFRRSNAHRNVYLLGVERYQTENWLVGVGVFSNSFGQPSAYAYGGYQWSDLFGQPRLYLKLTAGVMYGYVGEHKDKVPFNHNGWSPLVVPAIGYRLNSRHSLQVSALGTAGLLFS